MRATFVARLDLEYSACSARTDEDPELGHGYHEGSSISDVMQPSFRGSLNSN